MEEISLSARRVLYPDQRISFPTFSGFRLANVHSATCQHEFNPWVNFNDAEHSCTIQSPESSDERMWIRHLFLVEKAVLVRLVVEGNRRGYALQVSPH